MFHDLNRSLTWYFIHWTMMINKQIDRYKYFHKTYKSPSCYVCHKNISLGVMSHLNLRFVRRKFLKNFSLYQNSFVIKACTPIGSESHDLNKHKSSFNKSKLLHNLRFTVIVILKHCFPNISPWKNSWFFNKIKSESSSHN